MQRQHPTTGGGGSVRTCRRSNSQLKKCSCKRRKIAQKRSPHDFTHERRGHLPCSSQTNWSSPGVKDDDKPLSMYQYLGYFALHISAPSYTSPRTSSTLVELWLTRRDTFCTQLHSLAHSRINHDPFPRITKFHLYPKTTRQTPTA